MWTWRSPNRICFGFQTPNRKVYSDRGKEFFNVNDKEKAKALLKEAGYAGEELVLLTNTAARCDDTVFARMIARHADTCAELRGALSIDARLSLTNRQRVVDACAAALGASRFVTNLVGQGRAAQISHDASADAPLILIEHAEPETLGAFVHSLRDAGRLTSGLIMKALVFGRIDFVATVLADLSHRSEEQVRGVLVRGGQSAIRAVLKDVGLKGLMLDLAWQALESWRLIATGKLDIGSQELAWQLMRHAEQAETGHENDDLAALMRKIYLEIARANAQAHANDLLAQAQHEEHVAVLTAQALEAEIAHLLIEMEDTPSLDGAMDKMMDDAFFIDAFANLGSPRPTMARSSLMISPMRFATSARL
ncbi:MAG: DUF2336 domain-containing protein [Phyllobacteriaceae bacterium]|nr:DUF2336 domain-containing protein [Phyllobacteriaceae bacterium]